MEATKKKPKKKKPSKKELLDAIAVKDMEYAPKRAMFASFYLDPNSETYSNALQSALKAGFEHNYAKSLTSFKPQWLLEILGKLDIIDIARRNLKEDLKRPVLIQAMGPFGPLYDKKTKKPIMVESNKRIEMRQDMTKFALEKLDPDYRKREKNDVPPQTVVITQVIIKDPNGGQIIYDANKSVGVESVTETSGGLPAAA